MFFILEVMFWSALAYMAIIALYYGIIAFYYGVIGTIVAFFSALHVGFTTYRDYKKKEKERIKFSLDGYIKFKNSNSINIFEDIIAIKDPHEFQMFQKKVKERLTKFRTQS
jgi:hypothetical protein